MNLINTRESQFELLRIVAIFMVLIHHSLAVADTFGYTGHYTLNEGITGVLLNSAVIIGVNLFVLITGWFGVSDKKILEVRERIRLKQRGSPEAIADFERRLAELRCKKSKN